MSEEYSAYIEEHKRNVTKAFKWLLTYLPDIMAKSRYDEWTINHFHDESKHTSEEYPAYDAYFYGGNKSFKVVNDFNRAWLHHIHHNAHHWQHWVLINDDEKDGTIAIEMPFDDVIEMICDWWSFSFKSGNLYEIFDWYNDHAKRIILHKNTRALVETILNRIRVQLDEPAKIPT